MPVRLVPARRQTESKRERETGGHERGDEKVSERTCLCVYVSEIVMAHVCVFVCGCIYLDRQNCRHDNNNSCFHASGQA